MLSRLLCVLTLLVSSTASAQWEQISHDSLINCLYADSHTLYAGSYYDGGLLASSDSGVHWNVLFRTYEVDDLHSYHGRVFVAAGGAGVYAYDHDTTVQLTKKYCFSFADDGTYLYCGSQGCALRFDGSTWELDSIRCRNVSCGAIASYAAPEF